MSSTNPSRLRASASLRSSPTSSSPTRALLAMEVNRVYQLQNLCEILGIDLKQKILEEVDSTIDNPNEWIEKSQSLDEMTSKRLSGVVERLSQLKLQRFSQVRKMGSLILLYWIALSTPVNDQQDLINLFHFMDMDSADELKEPNSLSLAFIDIVEKEFNKLAQQVDDLVLQKKAKLKRLYEMTHLEYNFADTGNSDSLIALADVRLQISRAKAQVSKRQDIVTRIIFLQHANNEIQLQKDGVFEDDDKRTKKAKFLMSIFPKMLSKAEDKVADWNSDAEQPFEFDGVDARVILENFDASYKEAMEPEDVYKIPSPLRFGRTAPRTRRVLVQAPPPPPPPPPRSPPQPPSPPDSEKSDESMQSSESSMYKSDSSDPDFDPTAF